MIRENLTAGSAHAYAAISAGQGYLFQRRPFANGASVHTSGGSGVAPGWVRLKRAGDLLTAYRSANGTSWTVIGSDSIPMGDAVYVGIAVTSHNTSQATTAQFDAPTIVQAQAPNQPPAVTLSSPSNGASFSAPAAISLAASASDSDGSIARVEFYNGSTLLNSDSAAPYSFAWSNVAAGSYSVRAVAYDNVGASAASATAAITVGSAAPPAAPPAGQQSIDIGGPTAGSTNYSNGTYTVTAGGAGIWNASDQFRFVYQQANGDVDAALHVGSVTAADPYSSAGLMIRESLTSGSRHAFILLSAGRGYSFNQRLETNGVTQGVAGAGPAPGWVRLTRQGSVFTAYRSADGQTWTSVGSATISMATSAYVGIAVTANSSTATTTAVSDSLSVVQGAANQLPSVTLTGPSNGATFTAPATVAISATASDPDGTVARVDFFNGSTLLNSDATAPYAFTWSSVPAGTYAIRAVAYDNAGASATSATATVTVSAANTPPSVTLTTPVTGTSFSALATITIAASASDANGTIARVEFYNGSTLLNSDTVAPYSFAWVNVPVGIFAVRAVAFDNAGASASSATATITVSAALPPPTAVTFSASSDHATNVTSYVLEIFANGANPNTATPVASSDLGKPTPAANGDITVNRATLFSGLANGTYILTVSAIGPGGKTRSPSLTFTR